MSKFISIVVFVVFLTIAFINSEKIWERFIVYSVKKKCVNCEWKEND